MANRREFLNQLQDQLGSWSAWVKGLDDQAISSAAKLREDARAVYERRAAMVRDLIQQGRGQFDRISEASDDAWDGIAAGAEQAWASLKDVAASLAAQSNPAAEPAANEPAMQAAVGKAKRSAKPRRAAAKPAAAAKKAAGAKKKAKAAKKRPAKVKKVAKPVKKAKKKAKAKSRSAAAVKRKPAARKSKRPARKPARKK